MGGLFVTQVNRLSHFSHSSRMTPLMLDDQIESGIMGLSRSPETIVPSLVSAGKLDHTVGTLIIFPFSFNLILET